MVGGFGRKCIKYMLIVGNTLLSMSGMAIFVIALLIRYQDGARAYTGAVLDETSEQLKTDMALFAFIGFIMFVVGAVGAVGSGLESLMTLRLYVAFITLVGMTQLGVLISMIIMKEKMKRSVYWDIAVFVINYDLHSDDMRLHFNEMQRRGDCCGCNGRGDYRKLRYPVPDSCQDYQQDGCCPYIWKGVKIYLYLGGCVLVLSGIVEYVAAILTCIFISSISKSRYSVRKAQRKKKTMVSGSPVLLQIRERVETS